MKKKKNTIINHKMKESGLSIQEMYEMKNNNSSDYSTETFESLEFGEDQDFSHVINLEDKELNDKDES